MNNLSLNLISFWTICSLLSGFAAGGINWNGNNWAMSCDFRNNDLSNVRSAAEDCGGKCDEISECTHFSWTNWKGGTCWMKQGPISKNDAFSSNDRGMVCGVKGKKTRKILSKI
jgi:hypothetical protein